MEGDAEPEEVKPKRPPGKDTQIREKDAARIRKAESDEDEAREEAKQARTDAVTALREGKASAETDRDYWRTLTVRLIGAFVVLFVITLSAAIGVGVTGKIPGGYEITTVPTSERAAPRAERTNEAVETLDEEPRE